MGKVSSYVVEQLAKKIEEKKTTQEKQNFFQALIGCTNSERSPIHFRDIFAIKNRLSKDTQQEIFSDQQINTFDNFFHRYVENMQKTNKKFIRDFNWKCFEKKNLENPQTCINAICKYFEEDPYFSNVFDSTFPQFDGNIKTFFLLKIAEHMIKEELLIDQTLNTSTDQLEEKKYPNFLTTISGEFLKINHLNPLVFQQHTKNPDSLTKLHFALFPHLLFKSPTPTIAISFQISEMEQIIEDLRIKALNEKDGNLTTTTQTGLRRYLKDRKKEPLPTVTEEFKEKYEQEKSALSLGISQKFLIFQRMSQRSFTDGGGKTEIPDDKPRTQSEPSPPTTKNS